MFVCFVVLVPTLLYFDVIFATLAHRLKALRGPNTWPVDAHRGDNKDYT